MTDCNARCNAVAPEAATLGECTRGRGPRAHRVRCPRSGCRGQLYLECDAGGHVWDITCLLCSRSAGSVLTIDLIHRYGMTPAQVERAMWHTVPFLWHREDAP